jgi:hypothetical protein
MLSLLKHLVFSFYDICKTLPSQGLVAIIRHSKCLWEKNLEYYIEQLLQPNLQLLLCR